MISLTFCPTRLDTSVKIKYVNQSINCPCAHRRFQTPIVFRASLFSDTLLLFALIGCLSLFSFYCARNAAEAVARASQSERRSGSRDNVSSVCTPPAESFHVICSISLIRSKLVISFALCRVMPIWRMHCLRNTSRITRPIFYVTCRRPAWDADWKRVLRQLSPVIRVLTD